MEKKIPNKNPADVPLRKVQRKKEPDIPVESVEKAKDAEELISEAITIQSAPKTVKNSDDNKSATAVSKTLLTKAKEIDKIITPQTDESGNKKSLAQSTYDSIAENENVQAAISKSYKTIKKTVKEKSNQSKNNKKKPDTKIVSNVHYDAASQDMIPIKGIHNGIITTTTGDYIKILEILPINFEDMSVSEKEITARNFGTIFFNGPAYVHLKCIVDKSNPNRLIEHIKAKMEEEKYQRGISDNVVKRAQDTIDKIKRLSEESSLSKRYFLIYKYEGRNMDPAFILTDMESTKYSIISGFASMGHTIVDYGFMDSTLEAGEILYYFFNRNTCRTESLKSRIWRIKNDATLYNMMSSGKEKGYTDIDFISPKGLYFLKNHEYILMDGSYKTWLCLTAEGHPDETIPGWLDYISLLGGDGTEIDVHIKKLPRETTIATLAKYNQLKSISAREKRNNSQKVEAMMQDIGKNKAILDHLNAGEDLFNVMIIITLSASTISGLRNVKTYVKKKLESQFQLQVEECYANKYEYFMATLPLAELPPVLFNRNKRNYLTSSLETLYFFTSFETYDPTGYFLGENARPNNKSIVAINNFNTNYYANANISIFGMTGSGKTYSSQIIAKGMRIAGNRVFFICPLKAHEFYRGCMGLNGTYIQLGPGSQNRINICEIRPETSIDKGMLQDQGRVTNSLLAKKISSLLTWINLNNLKHPMSEDELDEAEKALTGLYYDFGFTTDNESVYDEDGNVRPSPYISDVYDRFAENEFLTRINKSLRKYVDGSCANMNGPTNVDLTNKYIVFDVDKDNMTEDLLPVFIYTVIDCVYSLVKQNRLTLDTVFLDEIWKLLMHPAAADQIYDMVKIIRGYGGCVIPITQDITDYLDSKVGQAILGGTAIKIIMYLEPTQCKRLANELDLTKDDIATITSFKQGQAMIVTNKGKTVVNIIASDMEDRDYTTDPNKLKHYAELENNIKTDN